MNHVLYSSGNNKIEQVTARYKDKTEETCERRHEEQLRLLFFFLFTPPLPHRVLGQEPANGELFDTGERGPRLTSDPGPLTRSRRTTSSSPSAAFTASSFYLLTSRARCRRKERVLPSMTSAEEPANDGAPRRGAPAAT